MLRRVLAAIALFGFAAASVLYWNDGALDPVAIAINFTAAGAGWLLLHYRWKRREARRVTPDSARDIFS